MSGTLWRCDRCDRLVDGFVNGCTCPSCGRSYGGAPDDVGS